MIYTIGREFGSGGHETGKALADLLGIPLYDKEFIEEAANVSGIKAEVLIKSEEKKESRWLYAAHFDAAEDFRGMSANEILFKVQSSLILEYAKKSDCVIVGRCADYVLDCEGVKHLSVFICAPTEDRIKRIARLRGIPEREAASLITRTDKRRRSYYEYYTGRSWGKPREYDLCLNGARFGTEKSAGTIAMLGEH